MCDALPPALACDEKLPPDQAGLGAALAFPFADPLLALKTLRVDCARSSLQAAYVCETALFPEQGSEL